MNAQLDIFSRVSTRVSARGMEFAFEDYRAFALSRGLRRPHVHQVWGSLAGMGQRMGLYEPTGEYRPARSIRTHGHPVRVLRVKARG